MSYRVKNDSKNNTFSEYKCCKCGECCRAGYKVFIEIEDIELWKKRRKFKL